MRSIIIEGPDNSGKSTLIEKLSRDLKMAAEHDGGPPKNVDDAFSKVQENLRKLHIGALCDRSFFISEVVYGSILKSPNRFSINTKLIETIRFYLYAQYKPLIIYCRPSDEKLLNMVHHEVKAHETIEHVKSVEANQLKLIKKYDEVMHDISCDYRNIIRYDYASCDYEVILNMVRKYIND